jgi:hypothetical protein
MAKKIKNLCVATGKWTGSDGVEHTNWKTIGSIIQKDDNGKFMLLDRTFNPAGIPNHENKDTIIVSMFDVKEKDAASTSSDTTPPEKTNVDSGNPMSDDDIPF